MKKPFLGVLAILLCYAISFAGDITIWVPPYGIKKAKDNLERDFGGRIGLGGRRVKQGLVYRSGGLNDNAITFDRPMEEWVPGEVRMTADERAAFLAFTGIRTDLDLRNERECFGMSGSPLGPSVNWIECSSWAYGELGEEKGKAAFAKVFKVFLDKANYPIDFHCITGADRTGNLAYILNGLLGVSPSDLACDYCFTTFARNEWTPWNTGGGFDETGRPRKYALDRTREAIGAFPGATENERIESYVKSLGFTDADIAAFRNFMLEPAGASGNDDFTKGDKR